MPAPSESDPRAPAPRRARRAKRSTRASPCRDAGRIPAARAASSGGSRVSMKRFERGQKTTGAPRRATRSSSSGRASVRCTPIACGPSAPRSSARAMGDLPGHSRRSRRSFRRDSYHPGIGPSPCSRNAPFGRVLGEVQADTRAALAGITRQPSHHRCVSRVERVRRRRVRQLRGRPLADALLHDPRQAGDALLERAALDAEHLVKDAPDEAAARERPHRARGSC